MKFSTVEIRPSNLYAKKFEVFFYDMDGDRYPANYGPDGLGFYHYPRKKGLKKAFNELKSLLIDGHLKEIKRLQESLESLRKLELPKTKE